VHTKINERKCEADDDVEMEFALENQHKLSTLFFVSGDTPPLDAGTTNVL